jgi:hypothetical protein
MITPAGKTCSCRHNREVRDENQGAGPLTHLPPEHTAPELLYLESKFASLMSYGLSMQMLKEVLPIGQAINAASIRNHVQSVAR